jgi:DNA-binding CsgD family transcriptional regulator/tetratricopeptide (TPR) repeat protein
VDSCPVGRDAEIAQIMAFLSAASGAPAVLAITGDAGIGKTLMWQHVLQAARRSSRVLSCRPTLAESPLAFSALDDLFGDVAEEILLALPRARRRAVEIALFRDASERPPGSLLQADSPLPERRILARGILDMMRVLSKGAPLVIAMDDTQWIDRPSAAVLEFCFRRLQAEPVLVLLTFRTDDPTLRNMGRTLSSVRLGRVQLGPLSLDAIREILRSQLGAVLPSYVLTRLYEACGGNPFFALECARTLVGRSRIPLTNEPIPIPHSLGDLMRRRILQLTPEVRRAGRLVAASPHPSERLIRAACDDEESWTAIDLAVDAGLIERDGEMLRFTHPLLRSALYNEMPLAERRQVHQRLGAATADIVERAWHLALSADRPSEGIAAMLDSAATHAASRGAPEEAAALTEQAARLTPADQPEAALERTVRAADYYFCAGDLASCRELIESALPVCSADPLRAPLLFRLATIYYHQSGWPLAEHTYREAAEAALDDPALCAHAEQELALARLVAGDLPGASRLARESLRSAEQTSDPRLVAHSLARVAVFEFLRGHGTRLDLLDKAEALDGPASTEPLTRLPKFDPPLVRGLILKWSDQLDEARSRLADRYRHGTDHGDEASLPFLLYHFSELECWAGNWAAAEEYALEACQVAEESRQQTMRPATLYSLALVRAHRGQVQQAQEIASEALALCDRTENVVARSMVLSVLGFIAMSLDDAQAAHAHLGRLADVVSAVGLGEPSVLKFLPDEIEALVTLGEVDLARAFTRQLEAQGKSLGRPWALATAARCRARLADLDGDLEGARASCERALSQHKRLPMPFELGRTLLVKGTIERHSKHQPIARTTLGQALAIFDYLGAPLWAAKARSELSVITARTPVDRLTETERRVAGLVVQGQTNREVATAMFVTENTVQTHLRHIFQKLGVRSRTELAARLLSASARSAVNGGLPPDQRDELIGPAASILATALNINGSEIPRRTCATPSDAAARNLTDSGDSYIPEQQ